MYHKEESVGWGKCLYLQTHKYAKVPVQTDTWVHECKHTMYTHAEIKYLRSTLFSQDSDQSLGACLCLCSQGQNIASSSLPARLMSIMFSKDQPRGGVRRDQDDWLVQRKCLTYLASSNLLGEAQVKSSLVNRKPLLLGPHPHSLPHLCNHHPHTQACSLSGFLTGLMAAWGFAGLRSDFEEIRLGL